MKYIIILLAALMVSACASQKLSTTGTPTPYDGLWKGAAISLEADCEPFRVEGEVKFGSFVGQVYIGSASQGEVWGELDAAGNIHGAIGASGFKVGTAVVKFGTEKAEGTWSASNCSGTLTMTKQR